jgi:uncharacterized protein (DUF1810 family)
VSELKRFDDAQNGVYESVCAELRSGRKSSHWMWFIFPQMRGLGFSSTANFYGISSRAEAEAYLVHPVLGPRLRECTRLVNLITKSTAHDIFGYPDDLKFRSSMTLFASITEKDDVFQQALDRYFDGEPDSKTLQLIEPRSCN